jgi:gamma-glutamyltranspeptidase/glutathione hydrolase
MPELLCKAEQSIGQGGFMLVRFNNPNGTHGYETIDFRETMPAAGNVTASNPSGMTRSTNR